MTNPSAPATPVLDLALLEKSEEAEFTTAEVVVPEAVKDFVIRAHEFWIESPKKWRKVTLGSPAAVREAARLASKYAKSTGRTFRVKKQDDASLLVYKVTDAIQRNGS